MHYNFDEIIERRDTACVKYDGVYQSFNIPNPSPEEYRSARQNGHDLLPMWVADMDFRAPNFVMEAIRKRAWHEILGYTFGDKDYWTAVTWWLSHRYHIQAQRKELHYIPGIVAGIAFALQTFSQPGDNILVTTPVYPPFLNLPQGSGRHLVCCPLMLKEGRFHLDFKAFEQAAKGCKIFILSNPHNPGGTVWTADELNKMAEICERQRLLVIADEIHADLTLPGQKHISYSTVSPTARDHSLTFIAPSKTFNIAGLSSSVCYCPNPQLRQKFFDDYLDAYEVANGNLFAFTGATAAFSKEGEEWLQQLLAYLQGNVDFMKTFLANRLPHVQAVWPQASFLAWLDFSAYRLPHHVLRHKLLEEAHVALNDGTTFGPLSSDNDNNAADNSPYANHFRLNFGCPRATLNECLTRIAKVLN
jgi:cystathionine beta-lyase